MRVHQLESITWVDSGLRSNTFNCVVGGDFEHPNAGQHAAHVVDYYRQRKQALAWRVGPRADPGAQARAAHHAVLEGAGLTQVEEEVGMVALLRELPKVLPPLPAGLSVQAAVDPHQVLELGRVLASVFEPFDAAAVRYYADISSLMAGARSTTRYFIGYVDAEPACMGALFFTQRMAGVYDIATAPHFRRRGFATAITLRALQLAREMGYQRAGLQASAMAAAMYRRLGFTPVGVCQVFS